MADTGVQSLSQQERCLLTLLLTGATITTAAAMMYVSKRTAESMLATLRTRTGAQTLYALGALAERFGWHDPQ